LHAFDWTIIILYLVGMIGLSFFLARGQKTGRDYYPGGNKTAPLPIALSTMATRCSTYSLLWAPSNTVTSQSSSSLCSNFSLLIFISYFRIPFAIKNLNLIFVL